MTLGRQTGNVLNKVLGLANLQLISKSRLNRLLADAPPSPRRASYSRAELPIGAAEYLRPDHPRLLEIKEKYKRVPDDVVAHSRWTSEYVVDELTLPYFRGDNAYVYQLRDGNAERHHVLTAYYVASLDRLGLLSKLDEDDLFGIYSFPWGAGRLVSRDLLDSILEIYFLEDTLGISGRESCRVLDIGAGYGRLAHRLTTAFPNQVTVSCTDALAESTFLSEYYLRYRGCDDRTQVIPLDELVLEPPKAMDVAVNIHSFSECSMQTVRWWLDFVKSCSIKYLMIVPNALDNGGNKLLTHERNKQRLDYLPELEARGYRLIAKRPKYADPRVQQSGVSPTHHYLFEAQN